MYFFISDFNLNVKCGFMCHLGIYVPDQYSNQYDNICEWQKMGENEQFYLVWKTWSTSIFQRVPGGEGTLLYLAKEDKISISFMKRLKSES